MFFSLENTLKWIHVPQSITASCQSPLVLISPEDMPTDEALLQDARSGDDEAIAALINRHGAGIFSYLRRIVHSHECAEDLFQETWIRVAERCGTLKAGTPVKPWIYRIALNLARDYLRRERTTRRGGGMTRMDDALLDTAHPVQPVARLHQELLELHRIVQKLPLKFRETVELRYFDDLSIQEIAQVLNKPVGTIKSRLARGLHQLENELRSIK
jgi:RNA polymerase sigma-70 factor (ECF subfamily)